MLPYRIKQYILKQRMASSLKGVLSSDPYSVSSQEEADISLHMQVCHRDLMISILALKSLLRFELLKFSVTFTLDFDVSAQEKLLLEKHFPGARLLPRNLPEDQRLYLKQWPEIEKLYLSDYPCTPQVTHTLMEDQCPVRMLMDSDVFFFKKPQAIQGFLTEDAGPRFICDYRDDVPKHVEKAFQELEQTLNPYFGKWRQPMRYFNSGLLLFRPEQLSMDVGEAYLRWWRKVDPELKEGQAAIWFGDWTPEQSLYHVMFAYANPEARPFEPSYSIGTQENQICNHFLRSGFFKPEALKRLKELVRLI